MDTKAFWEEKKNTIEWMPNETLNAAYNALDSNIKKGNGSKTALIYESEDGSFEKFTFQQLLEEANRFANLFKKYGILKGDRIFLFLPRTPQLYISFLGILKTGAIAGSMFSAFGESALKDRLENSGAKILLTTKELLERVEKIKKDLPDLAQIFVVDTDEFKNELSEQSIEFKTVQTKPEDYAFMLYTSGTTGKPKGVVHAHYGIIQQVESAKIVLDLKPEDIYWCTADPGWVTGIVYSILANWSLG